MKDMNEMLEEMKRLRAEDEVVQPSTQSKGNKMSQSNQLDVGKLGRYVLYGVLLTAAVKTSRALTLAMKTNPSACN